MDSQIDQTLEFEKQLNEFAQTLNDYVSTEDGQWSIKGFIDIYKNIYTISSDTKIVSKILEIHLFPELLKFAEDNGYKIILAEYQNYYPDLTFIKNDDSVMFAVDLKTTFRREGNSVGFTLGSHGAYFKERDEAKNIQFPYNSYSGHFCLGIVYTRVEMDELAETEIFKVEELGDGEDDLIDPIKDRDVTTVDNLTSIVSVIKDFEFFAVPKWKIASDRRGSGNTANIGSISNLEDMKIGNGVFSKLGEEWFDEYWMNYDAKMMRDGKSVAIRSIWDFLEFKGRLDLMGEVVESGAKRKPAHLRGKQIVTKDAAILKKK